MSTNDSFEPERIVIETSAVLVVLLFAFTQLLFAVLVSVFGESVRPSLYQLMLDALPWMAGASLLFITSAFVAVFSVLLTVASIRDKATIVAMRSVAYFFFAGGLAILMSQFASMVQGTKYATLALGFFASFSVVGLLVFLVLRRELRKKAGLERPVICLTSEPAHESERRYMKKCVSCDNWIPLASEICGACQARQPRKLGKG